MGLLRKGGSAKQFLSKTSSFVGHTLEKLRYPSLFLVGFDEFNKNMYSGDSQMDALSKAINKGVMTSILMPKNLHVPGTKSVGDIRKSIAISGQI